MPKENLPNTQIRALRFLANGKKAHYSVLREASRSTGSPKYVAERLRKRGYIETSDDQLYSITEKGLEVLKEQTSESYSYSLWKYP